MEKIQYTGVSELPDYYKEDVDRLSTEYYDKIQRKLKNLTSIHLHVKTYSKEGTKQKYSVHVKVIAPTKIFENSNTSDWDFKRALHKAFEDVQHMIDHSIRDNTHVPRRSEVIY